MSDSSIIREFLVRLGFVSDEPALKKFEDGIAQATKAVVTLGTAIEATAVAVGIGVARFASNLEALYFASTRTGASATNLKAFDRAARDMGASAGEAQASIESLARFMRNNPGGEGAIASWFGINTRDAHGKQLDPVQMAMAIAKSMQAMPQWEALMLGGKAGLSENTILAMLNPAFAKNFDTISERLKKAGFQDAAEHAHRFMEQLRTLGDYLVILGTRIEDALQQKLGISLKTITDWVRDNQQWIIDHVVAIGEWFIDTFNKVLLWTKFNWPQIQAHITTAIFGINWAWEMYLKPALEWMLSKFSELDEKTGGWASTLLLLAAGLKAIGATSIVGGVLSLAAAFVNLGAGLAGLGTGAAATGIGALARMLGLMTRGGPVVAGIGLGWLFDKLFPNNWLAQAGHALGGAVADAADYAGAQGKALEKRPQVNAMNTLINLGLSKEAAAGLVANFQAESSMNPRAENGSHYGLGQWDKNRQADFAKWAGFDIRDARAGMKKQLEFAIHELFYGNEQIAGDEILAAANNAARAGYVISHYYERHGSVVQDNLRSAAAVKLSHETTINIDGSGDPAAVAKHVAAEQERVARVSAAAVREFATMVQ